MSCLISPVDPSPQLLTRLHLQAVLPSFPDFLKHSEIARKFIPQSRFILRFSVRELSADLCFSQGRCRYRKAPSKQPTIHLQYFSYRQFNRALSGIGRPLPLPRLSPMDIPKLFAFIKLSTYLKNFLAMPVPTSTGERLLQVRLSMQVAVAAATVLIEHEPFSKSLLNGSEDWAIRLRVDGTDICLMIGQRNHTLRWGRNLRTQITAEIIFKDLGQAHESLQGTLDNMAAMNEGSLRIHGYLPLAERFSLVLERVPLYLQA